MDKVKLKEDYRLAACCSPQPPTEITGYYSHDKIIKIHSESCPELSDIEPERLIQLKWEDVIEDSESFSPGDDYGQLDADDFRILEHHMRYGIDYSLLVARKLNISKQEAFDRHQKLRDMKLLERVEPKMVQYRKGIVDNKWIKHRNHTYYDVTGRGRDYLGYFLKNNRG